jgi:hypothetical protein
MTTAPDCGAIFLETWMTSEDKAQEIELRQWEINNRSRGQVKYLPTEPGYGPEECDCGAAISVLRREYGFVRCVSCQTELEARR